MTRILVAILAVGAVSMAFTDLHSESVWRAGWLPVLDVLCLMALAVWLVVRFHIDGVAQSSADHPYTQSISSFLRRARSVDRELKGDLIERPVPGYVVDRLGADRNTQESEDDRPRKT
ncbi:MAG: hypothetical protein AAF184_16905 [Pseudomonadota bacterium]